MFKFLAGLFDENKKKLGSYQKIVEQINALEPTIKKLTDTQLAGQTKNIPPPTFMLLLQPRLVVLELPTDLVTRHDDRVVEILLLRCGAKL